MPLFQQLSCLTDGGFQSALSPNLSPSVLYISMERTFLGKKKMPSRNRYNQILGAFTNTKVNFCNVQCMQYLTMYFHWKTFCAADCRNGAQEVLTQRIPGKLQIDIFILISWALLLALCICNPMLIGGGDHKKKAEATAAQLTAEGCPSATEYLVSQGGQILSVSRARLYLAV